jgi:hypothetical protein
MRFILAAYTKKNCGMKSITVNTGNVQMQVIKFLIKNKSFIADR